MRATIITFGVLLLGACAEEHLQPVPDQEPEKGGGAIEDASASHDSDSRPSEADAQAQDADAADAAPVAPCGDFPAIATLDAAGPFAATSGTEGPECTVLRPKTLGQGGVRHPIILWGNGTGASVSLYKPGLELWASHGFIVVAANTTNGQGAGTPLIACLEHVMNAAAYKAQVCPRAGATGHSQGGGGALMAGRDPRVIVTAPLQPYIQQGYGGFDRASIPKQTGPMLLLSGQNDDNAAPATHQQPVFDETNVPVFWSTLKSGDHYSVAFGLPKYRGPMLAWFRLHLVGDETYRSMFYGPSCGLCADSRWIVKRKSID